MAFVRPEGVIIVKGRPEMGNGNEYFGIWTATGFARQLTDAEWELWGRPEPDHQIPEGADAEFDQLRDYDRGLRA